MGIENRKSTFDTSYNLKLVLGILLLRYLTCSSVRATNYDFIIAGGGTAGLAVARRLAEGRKHTVLVLECGGFPKDGMDVPAFAPRFLGDPDVTFQYPSTPQRNTGLRDNGIITVFSGKMLSGTSNLNYMVFNRGHPRDYNEWAAMTGDNSWAYSNMLKYFKRSESYTGAFPSDQHGFTGPIRISTPHYSPGLEQWLESGIRLGYAVADANGPQQRSVTPISFSKRYGRRNSAFVGYIQPIIAATPNLRIILHTNVTRIIFQGKRAVGVQFQSNATELNGVVGNVLYANKEVIVSAGAYGSALLLMRSGIGPKNVLLPARIPVVQELPVGRNLQDHVFIMMHIIINNKNLVMDEERDLNVENWEFFNVYGDGPYSSTLGITGQGFGVTSVAKSEGEADWPDLNLCMAHSVQAYFASGLMTNDSAIIGPGDAPMGGNVFLTRPKSRGTVSLNVSDPFGPPVVDVGYLTDPRDMQKFIDGIKEFIRIFEKEPYQKLGARFPPVDIPLCRAFPFGTDDYWRCYVSYSSNTGCHPAGTCRMGRGPSDPDAVVDTTLRVIGINGLRVVDASIMPVLTNSNTHAAVYGIAEKASDMILSDWQNNVGSHYSYY